MSSIIGFSWYARNDYDDLRATLVDSETFPQSYDAWLMQVEEVLHDFRKGGVKVCQVVVNPSDFKEHCRQRQVRPTAAAHKSFLHERLTEKLMGRTDTQAPTAGGYNQAIEVIDRLFGDGYSAKDPELVTAFVQTQVQKFVPVIEQLPWVSFPGETIG